MTAITVVVAARGKAVRRACLRILERERQIRVVGVARSGAEAMASIRLAPDVLLLGLDLLSKKSEAVLRALHLDTPRTRIILLVERAPVRRIVDALALGARGYLPRRTLPRFLAKAVQRVDAGEAWVPRRMVGAILDRFVRAAARAGGRSEVQSPLRP